MQLFTGCSLTSSARETNQQTQAEVKGLQLAVGPWTIHAAIARPGGAGPATLPRGQCRNRIPLSLSKRDDKNDLGGWEEGEKRD